MVENELCHWEVADHREVGRFFGFTLSESDSHCTKDFEQRSGLTLLYKDLGCH